MPRRPRTRDFFTAVPHHCAVVAKQALRMKQEDWMRICWFNDNRLGLVEGDNVRDAS